MTQTTHIRVAALMAAGFFVATHGIAHADTTTSGNGSIGGGNQIVLDVDAPINICGNAIAVLGVAGANCVDGEASVVNDSSTKGPYPGYDPEDPKEEPESEEPVREEPAEEVPEGEEEREEQLEEEAEEPDAEAPSSEPSEPASESASGPESAFAPAPTAPPADEQRLAVTGTDQSALAGMVAAAVLAIAVGAGLLLFGKRRRARA